MFAARWREARATTVPMVAIVVVVYLCTQALPTTLLRLVAFGLVGVGLALKLADRPVAVLLALAAFWPNFTLTFAAMLRVGVPAGVIRPLTGWKELLTLALAIHAVRVRRRRPVGLDGLDLALVASVGAIGVYCLLSPFTAPLGSIPQSIVSFRLDAFAPLLLFLARHVELDRRDRIRLVTVATAAWVPTALGGMAQVFFHDWWQNFVRVTIALPLYTAEVGGGVFNYLYLASQDRPNSLMQNQVTFAAAMVFPSVIAFALATSRARHLGVAAVMVGAVATSGGRLPAAAALAGMLWIMRRRHRTTAPFAHARLVGLAFVTVFLTLPVVAQSTVVERARFGLSGDDASARGHVTQVADSLERLRARPLGAGAVGLTNVGISESTYLQFGEQYGVPTMAAVMASVVLAVRQLRRQGASDLATSAVALAFGLMCIQAVPSHVWTEQIASCPVWLVAGAMAGRSRPDDIDAPDDLREEQVRPVVSA